jgi:hypothetical protein
VEGVPECAFVVAVDSNRAMGEIGMSTFSMQDIYCGKKAVSF